jgi:hypothetical protein
VDLDAVRVDPTVPPLEAPDGVVVAAIRPRLPEPGTGATRVAGDAESAGTELRLVPYHRWARRGPSAMRVWLPRQDHLDHAGTAGPVVPTEPHAVRPIAPHHERTERSTDE